MEATGKQESTRGGKKKHNKAAIPTHTNNSILKDLHLRRDIKKKITSDSIRLAAAVPGSHRSPRSNTPVSENTKIWLPENFSDEFRALLSLSLEGNKWKESPWKDTYVSNHRKIDDKMQAMLDAKRRQIEISALKRKIQDRTKIASSRSAPTIDATGDLPYYQGYLWANFSGDRFHRYWVALDGSVLYLCTRRTTSPGNYEPVIAGYIQLRSCTQIVPWTPLRASSNQSDARYSITSPTPPLSNDSRGGGDFDAKWSGKPRHVHFVKSSSLNMRRQTNQAQQDASPGERMVILAPVDIVSPTKGTPQFSGCTYGTSLRQHMLLKVVDGKESRGRWLQILHSAILNIREQELKTIGALDVGTSKQGIVGSQNSSPRSRLEWPKIAHPRTASSAESPSLSSDDKNGISHFAHRSSSSEGFPSLQHSTSLKKVASLNLFAASPRFPAAAGGSSRKWNHISDTYTNFATLSLTSIEKERRKTKRQLSVPLKSASLERTDSTSTAHTTGSGRQSFVSTRTNATVSDVGDLDEVETKSVGPLQFELLLLGHNWEIEIPDARGEVGPVQSAVAISVGYPTFRNTDYGRGPVYTYVKAAETMPEIFSVSTRFRASVMIEIEEKWLDADLDTRLRFEICAARRGIEHFVVSRFEIDAVDLFARPPGCAVTLMSNMWGGSLVVQLLPPLFARPRLLHLMRPMAQTYCFETCNGAPLIVREECSETHVTFLIPSLFLDMRSKEMRSRLDEMKRIFCDGANAYGSTIQGKKWSIWKTSYFERFEKMIVSQYNTKAKEYMQRYTTTVPLRSSKQKKQKEEISEKLKSVPLNLHLQVMTVAPYAGSTGFVPRAKRYTTISWGAPAVHSEGFGSGGLYTLREELHALEEERLLQLQERRRCKEELESEMRSIKRLQSRIEDHVETLKNQQQSLLALTRKPEVAMTDASLRSSTRNSPPKAIPGSTYDSSPRRHASAVYASEYVNEEEILANANAARRRLRSRKSHNTIEAIETLQNSLKDTKARLSNHKANFRSASKRRDLRVAELKRLREMTDELLRRREDMKLDLQQRHDAAVSQGVSGAVLAFLNHLEEIQGDFAAMERLRCLGLLFAQENLLSSNTKDKGMTEDQLAVTLALQLVAFRVVREKESPVPSTKTKTSSSSKFSPTSVEGVAKDRVGETEYTGLPVSSHDREQLLRKQNHISMSRSKDQLHVKITSKRANPHQAVTNDGKDVVLALLDPGSMAEAKLREFSTVSASMDADGGGTLADDEPLARMLTGDGRLRFDTSRSIEASSKVKNDKAKSEENVYNDEEDEDEGVHMGYLWKEAASGRVFGFATKHWDKRWMVLRRGRLTWYADRAAVKERNSLLLDGYTLKKVGQVQSWIQFELVPTDPRKRVLRLRERDKSKCQEWIGAIEKAIHSLQKDPLHFGFAFAGYKFLAGDETSRAMRVKLKPDYAMSLEPIRQIVVDVAVPNDIFVRLTPGLQAGDLVRLRPVLFAQGINAGERVLDAFSDVTQARSTINLLGIEFLWSFFEEYKQLPQKLHGSRVTVDTVEAILSELDQMLNDMVEEGCRKYEVLLLAADATRHLGGVRLTNCMSGKDRTGMSVTLEQARILAQSHMLIRPPLARPTGKRRTAKQLVTFRRKPNAKRSRVMEIADMMRICGPRLHNCRKNAGKPAYACTVVHLMPSCYRPPDKLSNQGLEA
eukprot:g202.t1